MRRLEAPGGYRCVSAAAARQWLVGQPLMRERKAARELEASECGRCTSCSTSRWKSRIASFLLLALAALAVLLVFSLQPEIQPIARPDISQFRPAQIARGKTLAALGDCGSCHTRADGPRNAGGQAFRTRFGTIYSSNITPDVATGIGSWSYPAFKRVMRYGINRQGHYLYPAFPDTTFTLTRDEDLQDLYAWLMTRPAVNYRPPPARLRFPFNLRQDRFVWNWLLMQADPQHGAKWNRGALFAAGPGRSIEYIRQQKEGTP